MSETSTLIGYGGRTIGREELALVPTPAATETHRPVPHHEIVQALVETLGLSPHRSRARRVRSLAGRHEGLRRSRSRNRDGRMPFECRLPDYADYHSDIAVGRGATRILNRHNQRPSKKARSWSLGRYRTSLIPSG